MTMAMHTDIAERPQMARSRSSARPNDFPAKGSARDEKFRIANGGHLMQRHQRTWSNTTAAVSDIQCDGSLDIDLFPTRPMLLIAAEEVGGRLEVLPFSQGALATKGQARSEPISVLPGGFRARARSGSMRYCKLFSLDLDESYLRSFFKTTPGSSGTIDARLMFLEPRMVKICQLLIQECVGREVNGTGYADSLVSALLLALSSFSDQEDTSSIRGGLAPWQLRRVQAYMAENIAERISTRELADIAQVSVTHFHRAFKASVGCAPHHWLIGARIAESKKQLMSDGGSLAEISLGLGFCDQAHFTRLFTKWVGSSPLAWQKASIE